MLCSIITNNRTKKIINFWEWKIIIYFIYSWSNKLLVLYDKVKLTNSSIFYVSLISLSICLSPSLAISLSKFLSLSLSLSPSLSLSLSFSLSHQNFPCLNFYLSFSLSYSLSDNLCKIDCKLFKHRFALKRQLINQSQVICAFNSKFSLWFVWSMQNQIILLDWWT